MVITDADGYQGEIVVYNPADLSETVVFLVREELLED